MKYIYILFLLISFASFGQTKVTVVTKGGTVKSVSTGVGLTGGPVTNVGTISLDTASATVISRQRAVNQYAALTSHNFFTSRNNFQGLTVNKDSVPISTTNAWLATVDTTTGRIQRRNVNTLIDTLSSTLLADVSMTSSVTWYSGPSVVLPVGVWLITSHISTSAATGTHQFDYRIFDGTNAVASSQTVGSAGTRQSNGSMTALAIVASGTTTYTLQAYSTVATSVMKAATNTTSQAGATRIIAIKIK